MCYKYIIDLDSRTIISLYMTLCDIINEDTISNELLIWKMSLIQAAWCVVQQRVKVSSCVPLSTLQKRGRPASIGGFTTRWMKVVRDFLQAHRPFAEKGSGLLPNSSILCSLRLKLSCYSSNCTSHPMETLAFRKQ